MEKQNRLELLNYLTQEDEQPNLIKQKYLEREGHRKQEENDKENRHNKMINESIKIFSTASDHNNENINNNIEYESSIGDTRSFYRENGILDDFEQLQQQDQDQHQLPISSLNSSHSNGQLREMQLQEWLERKKCKNSSTQKSTTPNRTPFGKSTSFSNQNSAEKSAYISGAQLAAQYFSGRSGYAAEGKGSISQNTATTKPKSPKFETAQRSQIHALKLKRIAEEQQQQQNSEPNSNTKSVTKKIDPKTFFLETEKRARSRPQTSIQEEQEEFSFKARPMPEFKEVSIVKPERIQTEFKQFSLTTDERGRSKEKQHKNKAQQVDKQLVSATSPSNQSAEKQRFKAKKMPDFASIPTPPKPSPRKATVPIKLVLQSTVRAVERKLFDSELKEHGDKESSEQRSKEQAELIKEENERDELKKAVLFKANPIKKYKPIELRKSDIPLTQPESPKFHTDQRLRNSDKSQQLD